MKQLSLSLTITEPHAAATEAQVPRAHALQREATTMRSLHTTTREKPVQQQSPSTAKTKLKNKIIF